MILWKRYWHNEWSMSSDAIKKRDAQVENRETSLRLKKGAGGSESEAGSGDNAIRKARRKSRKEAVIPDSK